MDLSKDDLQNFNPNDPLYRGKLWMRVVTPDRIYTHYFPRRIAIALATIAVAGWLATAAGVWAFVKFDRGYTEARFLDLAFYPVRAEHYRTGLGQHYLKRGRTELEKKNYTTGYALLLAGLARVPDDVPARRLVAFTQVRFGRADQALKTLADGALLATADLDYLKLLFALLLESQEDDRVIALAQTLLPPQPDAVLTHQFVALQAATAHYQRGRYDEAERLLTAWHLADSLEGEILLAQCDWERGLPGLALRRLEGEVARFPDRDELYLQLVRFHRELGHQDEARRYALLRQLHAPTSPGAHLDLLHTYRASNDRVAEKRELEAYLTSFKSDPQALVLLAWFAVDTAQPALALRLRDLARSQNLPANAFNLARVQAALAAQEYRSALTLADTALREENEDNPNFTNTLNGLRALALFGLKETARAELLLGSFLGQAHLRAADALLLAKQLRLLGVPASARAVLERACIVDPLNQAALGELVRADAEAGDRAKLAEHLPKFLRLRKPSRPILEETLLHLEQPADAPLRDQIRAALTSASATPAP